MKLLLLYGGCESAAEQVWTQLGEAGLQHEAIFVAHAKKIASLRCRLGHNVPVIAEPESRGVFAAAAFAGVLMRDRMQLLAHETVCVLPVNECVDGTFLRHLLRLERVLKESLASVALLGVRPRETSPNDGYIVPAATYIAGVGDYCAVRRYVDKPAIEEAYDLFVRGALRSCGVAVFRLGVMLELLRANGWPIQAESLVCCYSLLPNVGVEQMAMEHALPVVAVPYDGKWTHRDSDPFRERAAEYASVHRWTGVRNMHCASGKTGAEVWVRSIRLKPGEHLHYPKAEYREVSWTIVSGLGVAGTTHAAHAIGDGDMVQLRAEDDPVLMACTPVELVEVLTGNELRGKAAKFGSNASA